MGSGGLGPGVGGVLPWRCWSGGSGPLHPQRILRASLAHRGRIAVGGQGAPPSCGAANLKFINPVHISTWKLKDTHK